MPIFREKCNLSKTSVCDQKMVFMLSRVKKININLGKASVSCVWDLYLIFKLQIVQFKNKSGQKIKKTATSVCDIYAQPTCFLAVALRKSRKPSFFSYFSFSTIVIILSKEK